MARHTTQPDTERNTDGTFALGNGGGPGRPARTTERQYMAVVMAACDLDTWQAIVERAVTDAKNGDSTARAWLASYLLGKPPSRTAPRPTYVLAAEHEGVDEVADAVADIHEAQADAQRRREFDTLIHGAFSHSRR